MKLHKFRLEKILKMDFRNPKPGDTLFIQLNHRSLNCRTNFICQICNPIRNKKYSNRQSCHTFYKHQV